MHKVLSKWLWVAKQQHNCMKVNVSLIYVSAIKKSFVIHKKKLSGWWFPLKIPPWFPLKKSPPLKLLPVLHLYIGIIIQDTYPLNFLFAEETWAAQLKMRKKRWLQQFNYPKVTVCLGMDNLKTKNALPKLYLRWYQFVCWQSSSSCSLLLAM